MAARRRKKDGPEEEKKDLKEKVTELLELPREIILDVPKLVFIGNKELSIENYKGVIEYGEKMIRVNANAFIIKVTGHKLEIKTITSDEIVIIGNIASIEFVA